MNEKRIWKALLRLGVAVKAYPHTFKYCSFCDNGLDVVINFDQLPEVSEQAVVVISFAPSAQEYPASVTTVQLLNLIDAKILQRGVLSEDGIQFLRRYLPYCFLTLKAKQEKRAVSIAHFAQSLDGKIATHLGDSKWIGNEENLIHAHRMRAMCDAILIGKETLQADQPRLTVRKVEGEDPRKVVLGSPNADYGCLTNAGQKNQVLLIGQQSSTINNQVQYCQLAGKNGKIDGLDILSLLYEQNLHSVYIEGGAKTTSNFLNDQGVDILQLHISPLVFGSGIQGVVLPKIEAVAESIHFQHFQYQNIGDSIMFVGSLAIKQSS
ncbi:MAG: RibD family protein [Saprospiraceae bacterium]